MTLKSIQGHEIFKKLYLINGACYDQSLYETHIGNHKWPFNLPSDLWTWKTLKRLSQFHGNFKKQSNIDCGWCHSQWKGNLKCKSTFIWRPTTLTIESKRFQDNNQCIWGIWLMIVINVFGIQLGIYSDKLHKDFINQLEW